MNATASTLRDTAPAEPLSATRPRWALDISALADPDQARLRALLIRAREHTTYDWVEADGTGCDVRLVDEHGADTVPMSLWQPKAVVQLVDSATPAQRVYENYRLVRPLLLSTVVDLLLRLEARFTGQAKRSAANEATVAMPDAAATPSTLPASANEGVAVVSPAYQLRKWPPVKMLLREDTYAQLAALFSSQALTIAQASRMSRVRYTQCWEFIKESMKFGVVEVYTPNLLASAAGAAPAMAWAPQARRVEPTGVFARLCSYLR